MFQIEVKESKSLEDTKKIAEDFLHLISTEQQKIVGLEGNLGSGKTTFVQCLAKILGIAESVQSPTFVIQKTYFVNSEKFPTIKTLYHFDLYRIEHSAELAIFNLEEVLSDPSNLILIEWPEKAQEILKDKIKTIHFEFVDDTVRRISYLHQ